jgi:polyisoprenoid-binding protein YceI
VPNGSKSHAGTDDRFARHSDTFGRAEAPKRVCPYAARNCNTTTTARIVGRMLLPSLAPVLRSAEPNGQVREWIMRNKSLWGVTVTAWLFAQSGAPAGQGSTVLTIDPGESRVTILVGKAGVLSFAGHAHEVVAPAVRGRVTFDPMDWPHATVSLEVDATAMRLKAKDEAASDVPTVEKTMLGAQVLDVEHFPTITFRSRRVSVAIGAAGQAAVTIDGDMALHGKTRPMTVRASASVDASGRVTATGAFTLKQTDFGMIPVTAAGGTIRVKDDLDVQFVLKASPTNDATSFR